MTIPPCSWRQVAAPSMEEALAAAQAATPCGAPAVAWADLGHTAVYACAEHVDRLRDAFGDAVVDIAPGRN